MMCAAVCTDIASATCTRTSFITSVTPASQPASQAVRAFSGASVTPDTCGANTGDATDTPVASAQKPTARLMPMPPLCHSLLPLPLHAPAGCSSVGSAGFTSSSAGASALQQQHVNKFSSSSSSTRWLRPQLPGSTPWQTAPPAMPSCMNLQRQAMADETMV